LPSTSLVLLNQQLAIDPYHPSAIVSLDVAVSFQSTRVNRIVENRRLRRLTKTRVLIVAAWACDPCSVSQELPSLRTRAAALSFNRIAVLLNANTAVLASNLSASHACVAYLMVGTGDFHPDPDCGELT
jgi:hypothetical protein